MLLWNVSYIARNLKENRLSQKRLRFYAIASPILSIMWGLFFGTVILGHHIAHYAFSNHLKKPDINMSWYNKWSYAATAITIIIAVIGFFVCKKANKIGDNKDFFKRFTTLSFTIQLPLLIYTFIFLALGGYCFYILFQEKILLFKESLFPPIIPSLNPSRIYKNPLKLLKLPLTVFKFPFLGIYIKAFIKNLRAMTLMIYPVLVCLPPFISLIQYFILYRYLKYVASPQNSL